MIWILRLTNCIANGVDTIGIRDKNKSGYARSASHLIGIKRDELEGYIIEEMGNEDD